MSDRASSWFTASSLQQIEKWRPLAIVLLAGIWTVATAVAAGWWAVYQFEARREDEKTERTLARIEAERNTAIAHRIEAQKPFLQKKLEIYFETIQIAERLVEWELNPLDDKWKVAAKRFWELRWGELEMVGDAGIRQAARRVGQQIVETENDPRRDRHDLRWMIECLADELRLSLEHAWGFDAKAARMTATGEAGLKLPNGCGEGRAPPHPLSGMKPLVASGNNLR